MRLLEGVGEVPLELLRPRRELGERRVDLALLRDRGPRRVEIGLERRDARLEREGRRARRVELGLEARRLRRELRARHLELGHGGVELARPLVRAREGRVARAELRHRDLQPLVQLAAARLVQGVGALELVDPRRRQGERLVGLVEPLDRQRLRRRALLEVDPERRDPLPLLVERRATLLGARLEQPLALARLLELRRERRPLRRRLLEVLPRRLQRGPAARLEGVDPLLRLPERHLERPLALPQRAELPPGRPEPLLGRGRPRRLLPELLARRRERRVDLAPLPREARGLAPSRLGGLRGAREALPVHVVPALQLLERLHEAPPLAADRLELPAQLLERGRVPRGGEGLGDRRDRRPLARRAQLDAQPIPLRSGLRGRLLGGHDARARLADRDVARLLPLAHLVAPEGDLPLQALVLGGRLGAGGARRGLDDLRELEEVVEEHVDDAHRLTRVVTVRADARAEIEEAAPDPAEPQSGLGLLDGASPWNRAAASAAAAP
ncbi:MAG: hypothetical protein H6745_25275 [Deltaproteobacteria bacterium]|nr:hypothetical protein [Deltaproteobacteria bacterium]